mmetsp:Transcript_48926/g.151655  ORF Transcript_48926/g.151655 Transcript_48926/m.151655 type:complete len:331 (-) Transcript_48926:27-1019(-)
MGLTLGLLGEGDPGAQAAVRGPQRALGTGPSSSAERSPGFGAQRRELLPSGHRQFRKCLQGRSIYCDGWPANGLTAAAAAVAAAAVAATAATAAVPAAAIAAAVASAAATVAVAASTAADAAVATAATAADAAAAIPCATAAAASAAGVGDADSWPGRPPDAEEQLCAASGARPVWRASGWPCARPHSLAGRLCPHDRAGRPVSRPHAHARYVRVGGLFPWSCSGRCGRFSVRIGVPRACQRAGCLCTGRCEGVQGECRAFHHGGLIGALHRGRQPSSSLGACRRRALPWCILRGLFVPLRGRWIAHGLSRLQELPHLEGQLTRQGLAPE